MAAGWGVDGDVQRAGGMDLSAPHEAKPWAIAAPEPVSRKEPAGSADAAPNGPPETRALEQELSLANPPVSEPPLSGLTEQMVETGKPMGDDAGARVTTAQPTPDGCLEGETEIEQANAPADKAGMPPTDTTRSSEALPADLAQWAEQIEQRMARMEEELARLRTPNAADPPNERPAAEDAAPSRSAPAFALGPLVEEAVRREAQERSGDEEELARQLSRAQQYAEQAQVLRERLETVGAVCRDLLEQAAGARASLPLELQERLSGRHEGLALITRMVEALPHKAEELDRADLALPPFVALEETAWQQVLEGEVDQAEARKRVERQLKAMGDERYRQIASIRDAADRRCKQLQAFIKGPVLRVLDGLDAGEADSGPLLADGQRAGREASENLALWLGTYPKLRDEISGEVLAAVGVHTFETSRGMPIDWERHDPDSVEPDADLPNESVKEVLLNGYEYGSDGEKPSVLRPARVVVVKN